METIHINVNGKEKTAPGTIESFVRGLGLNPKTVVVEHNLRVVPAREWANTNLAHGDQLELLSFVGGG